ncbi:Histone acetyltransferase type B catalytic subunit [Mycena indigotica]|uniref:Histone acetyltransferase type B catalytic subunit n=1 Tax=Mycena indigotica TaxID=2126181 RepID=A0A8H6S898_9AGAR|nr:Histone acetyltransferase type B catalytic subunit [Mycena indigotica]KAF7294688.1 Histone acetyltransferase type B catalytic subunit [Mycena indigotica]
MTDWTADANQALCLSLVRAQADDQVEETQSFHPRFTYPIYGDDEKIYGYNGLTIDLRFASGSLAPFLNIKYAKKLDSSSTVDDVEGTLAKFLPEDVYRDEKSFLERVEVDSIAFKPPGELIRTYTRSAPPLDSKGKGIAILEPNVEETVVFEAYHATWASPGFRELHRRMQLFILLYIEAGSYIDEEEDTWEFIVLYEKRKRRATPDVSTYHFVGYTSLYPFFCFPDRVRLRLSQFVILPPYQRSGHGSELYNALYQYVMSKPKIAELTVEDPAEAFEDLRDKNDLLMLLGNKQFMEEAIGGDAVSHGGGRVGGVGKGGRSGRGGSQTSGGKGKLGPPVDRAWREKWRSDLKMAARQFHRLIEMLILLRLDPTDESSIRAYRLQVKERLYRFNFETLTGMDKEERLEKLEETFQGQREDYMRILALLSH